MKEAFEKIIKKLEEKRDKYENLAGGSNFDGYHEEEIEYLAMQEAFEKAIEIVNQVAEEVLEKEFSEWCHDCKEYDKEKHHCPRWCKVIRTTVEEIKGNLDVPEINVGKNGGWIPCSERLPQEEYDTVWAVTDRKHYCVAVYTTEHGFRTMDIDCEGNFVAWKPITPYQSQGDNHGESNT